ncbi:MAG: pyridoxamine 5'-phosphate oxidase family protein [Parvibaculum sp.]|nr:pyridoxamine 5'-phosphate oxidase family protein [Parvibaculum sp.]
MSLEPALKTVRALLENEGEASLATLDGAGFPFASLVTFATDDAQRPLLLLSKLAQHTTNLETDTRASLLIGKSDMPDTQTRSRATLVGHIAPLEEAAAIAAARTKFLARHPSAETYVDFNDFRFFAMTIDHVHVVEGFGRIVGFPADALYA